MILGKMVFRQQRIDFVRSINTRDQYIAFIRVSKHILRGKNRLSQNSIYIFFMISCTESIEISFSQEHLSNSLARKSRSI